ncbi:hypothetical protein [Actinacidiphila soli]|uniref:hypothetical protein n=1 Tax=Actinacidiphila soli TaxID=2487275 RepID=UPI000FCBA5C8|nr:hypothetical protein [Actinacidiphila soli]
MNCEAVHPSCWHGLAQAHDTRPANGTIAANGAQAADSNDGRGGDGGLRGYQIVTKVFPTAANGTPQTAPCPSRKRVTGGGVLVPVGVVQGSYPTADGQGWMGVGFSNGTGGITVYAVCVDRGRGI